MEIHEFLLLKHGGAVEHFPVPNGDPDSLAQARFRASLSHHPGDVLVLVTEGAYIRVAAGVPSEQLTLTR